MEVEGLLYYTLTIAICCIAVSSLLRRRHPATATVLPPLPPGPPPPLSLITPLLFLGRTNFGIERVLAAARARYGPVFTLHLLPSLRSRRPAIFVAGHAAAHRALVQAGAAFADRPPASLPFRVFSSGGKHNITSAPYGPLWRALRHNLTGKVFHRSRLARFAAARRQALDGLVAGVGVGGDDDDGRVVVVVVEIDVCPKLTRLLLRRRWSHMLSLRRRQEQLFAPLIRAACRRRAQRDDDDDDDAGGAGNGVHDDTTSYVDTLVDLRIPEDEHGGGGGRRRLTEGEMVSLCAEFVAVGTDNTATEAQWIMANLVAQPEIQAKLRAEIHHVTGGAGGIREEDLPRMPYLRAVVLEGLRRHPPGHFAIPHAATGTDDDGGGGATLEGFRVPRRATLNFPLVALGLDEAVWPDPLRFRPERFMAGGEGADVDLTGAREVRMIPFGAGRRICPGMAIALLHLQFFVAGLVAEFEWAQVPGEPVEFAEKQELSVVMRRPLRAVVVRCTRNAAGEPS